MEAQKISRLSRECSDCGGAKTIFISLQSSCDDCGLEPLDLNYEIPVEKVNEILAEIASTIKNKGLQTTNKQVAIPTYDELVRRLSRTNQFSQIHSTSGCASGFIGLVRTARE
jgi:hypothetical protein